MEVKNEKKVLVLSFLGVITFIAVVVGATYAYFAAQGGNAINTNVNVQTATTDNLSFQVGESISLTANQEDFGIGAANKSGSTYARATLTANNATNNATRNYYVYLNITSNNFEYTTADEQAELLLKVTGPDGSEVTSITSLTRKTSGGEIGFDITSSNGLITIADNYEIVSTGTVTQDWQVEVIFANLDSDQNANTGKSFSANLIISEDVLSYHEICIPGTMACDIAKLYTTDGENELYYHDGVGTYTNADQEAGDYSYRYAGANPNNYVCFGSDEEVCPIENIYRIIGVFNNQVKLIKYDYAGEDILGIVQDSFASPDSSYYKGNLNSIPYYYWSGSSTSTSGSWNTSLLNINVLNGTYLSNLGNSWSNLIANHNWNVGGNTWVNIGRTSVKTAYINEIVNSVENIVDNTKIGLMYVSDYGYASSPENWSLTMNTLNTSSNTDNNWLYMGAYEWMITPGTDDSSTAFHLFSNGRMSSNIVNLAFAIRPSFYLFSNVKIIGGTGTQLDPYRISI